MSGNYKAIVCRVEELNPIPGADRIELATVAGEQVIVQKGLWKTGDVGIFFPVSVILSHDLMMYNKLYRKHPETGEAMGGYMEPDRRVRFIKMKGASSRGLFLPTSCVDFIKQVPALSVGQEFDELNGITICERYTTVVPVVQDKNQKVGKQRSKKFVNFYEIGDTSHLTTNLHRFKKDDVWVVTEKLHGTSARTGNVEVKESPNWVDKILSKFGYERKKTFKPVSGTRRTVIGENDKTSKENYRQYFHRLFKAKLKPGQIVYYEIVGPGIMPTHNAKELKDIASRYGSNIEYSYGVERNNYRAYVYKIVEVGESGDPIVYSWDQVVDWCEKHEVDYVPVITKLIYNPENRKLIMEMIGGCADGESMLGNHPKEGVVVQTRFGPFKFKGDTFCMLEGIMLNSEKYIDPEDAN